MKKNIQLALVFTACHFALLAQISGFKSTRLKVERPFHPKVEKFMDRTERLNPNAESGFAMKWHMDSVDIQGYRSQTHPFRTIEKLKYAYDASGRCYQMIQLESDSLGSSFNPFRKVEYAYNPSGQLTRIAFYDYDTSSSSFVLSGHILNRFINNLLYEQLQQEYHPPTGTYTHVYRESRTYNNTRLLVIQAQRWDEGSAWWKNVEKREFSYNANQEISEIKLSEYQQAEWREDFKIILSYNNGLLAQETFTERFLGSEETFAQFEYLYDALGNNTDCKYYEAGPGELALKYIDLHSYNTNIDLSQLVLPLQIWVGNYLMGKFVSLPLKSKFFKYGSNGPIGGIQLQYNYYNNQREGTGIEEYNQKYHSLHVFPNPAIDVISFDIPFEQPYVIIDSKGQEIGAGRSHDGRINVSHLGTGVYTLVIGYSRAHFIKN